MYERCCAEIVTQTALLTAAVAEADPLAPVPDCPGWTLGQLLRHVGGTHRWAGTVVRTRATEPVSDEQVNDVPPRADDDPAALAAWLTEGAASLAGALRAVGPRERMWTPPPQWNALFWARRMTFETVVHRSDAFGAVGVPYTLDDAVARDGIDEWLGFSTLPQAYESPALMGELLAPGRSLSLRAVPEGAGEWVIDLGGDIPALGSTGEEKPTATVQGTPADLLLLLYLRRSARSEGIEVDGDGRLFADWAERAGHWLRK